MKKRKLHKHKHVTFANFHKSLKGNKAAIEKLKEGLDSILSKVQRGLKP